MNESLTGLRPPGFPGIDPPPRKNVVHGQCVICSAPWTTSFEFADSTCEHVRFKYRGNGKWDVAYVTRRESLTPLLRDFKNRLYLKRFGIKIW